MTAAYWAQWERSDLDEWQGITRLAEEDDIDPSDYAESLEELSESELEQMKLEADYPCCGGRGCNTCLT